MPYNKRQYLLYSTLGHLVVLLILVDTQSNKKFFNYKKITTHREQVLDVKLNPQTHKKIIKSTQIVQMDEKLKKTLQPQTNEKVFLSKHNSQADKNTRAAKNGRFKNVLTEGLNSESQVAQNLLKNIFEIPQQLIPTKSPAKLSTGKTLNFKKRTPSSIKQGTGLGTSATDDFFDDTVAIGSNTLLNTQEFKYYGFYERIRSLISDPWRGFIEDAIAQNQTEHEAFHFRPGQYSTQVEVFLNANGDLSHTRLTGLSGLDAFDQAALSAFHSQDTYPNPPEQLLQNGGVKINWHFVVDLSNKAFSIQFKRKY